MTRLTPRQGQIVRLLVQGASQKEAARQLGLSHAAVRSHMFKARDRIAVKSTAELVYQAHDELTPQK
jgi:DNA-binding NarL/FixJ family response regulator